MSKEGCSNNPCDVIFFNYYIDTLYAVIITPHTLPPFFQFSTNHHIHNFGSTNRRREPPVISSSSAQQTAARRRWWRFIFHNVATKKTKIIFFIFLFRIPPSALTFCCDVSCDGEGRGAREGSARGRPSLDWQYTPWQTGDGQNIKIRFLSRSLQMDYFLDYWSWNMSRNWLRHLKELI